MKYRAESGYLLKADVNAFYPSIYTHSIPWALVGRELAKSAKFRFDKKRLENLLDMTTQDLQDGQTKGVPIGPDTSFVLAELVLSSCDIALKRSIRTLMGFRYYDDYELYCNSREEAEKTLDSLQYILSRFELSLNPHKTSILSLPQPLDYAWALRLREYRINDCHGYKQRDAIIGSFETAFEYVRQGVDDHILRYLLGITSASNISPGNWQVYEKFLWQTTFIEPSVLPIVLYEILSYKQLSSYSLYVVDSSLAGRVLNEHIIKNSRQGHTHEVVWALWGLFSLSLQLTKSATQAIIKMDDPFAYVMIMIGIENDFVQDNSLGTNLEKYYSCDNLRYSHWLLTYEASVRGWKLGNKVPGGDWHGEFQELDALRKSDISFTRDRFYFEEKEFCDIDDYEYWPDDDTDDDEDSDDMFDDVL